MTIEDIAKIMLDDIEHLWEYHQRQPINRARHNDPFDNNFTRHVTELVIALRSPQLGTIMPDVRDNIPDAVFKTDGPNPTRRI